MTKLQEIENKLRTSNEAVFQNVCDAVLYTTEDKYTTIARTGSQIGKQKTRKGTPDTYFQLANGLYVFVEYTTKEKKETDSAFLKKAIGDINKCLDEKKTKVKHSQIAKIIFCFNSRFAAGESHQLQEICNNAGVKLEFKTIDDIAMGLLGRCTWAAKEFLGISIDSGQVQTQKNFIKDYESNSFATPLSNRIYGRENELNILFEALSKDQIIILSGPAGVGKSRLILEVLKKASKNKPKYTAYCLSNKNAPINDDLRLYLSDDKPYLVFIDDGNRQSNNLRSLLGIMKEARQHPIKIVITVRDYALGGLKEECVEYQTGVYALEKLTDDVIESILKSDEFKIKNGKYLKRILEIADGNPRLAIMAARVALLENDLSALNDVSIIYDKYFENAIGDKQVFNDQSLLKTLGLVSFFFSINLDNREFCSALCEKFGISEYDFKENLIRLDKLELIEATSDFSVVRVAEQVLSTYFFYKTFLKDGILDFNVALVNYFKDYSLRFNDTVMAANNTFSYNNVLQKVDPFLITFWSEIKSDYETALSFLKIFWYYKHDEVLAFVFGINSSVPIPADAKYEYDAEKQNRSYESKNEILSLLTNLFNYETLGYADAVELAFEYVKRKPELFESLIKSIQEAFVIDADDLAIECERQANLYNQLVTGLNKHDNIYVESYFILLPFLLKTSYRIFGGSRKQIAISYYQHNLALTASIRKYRTEIWNQVIQEYPNYSEKYNPALLKYVSEGHEFVKAIYEFDLHLLHMLFKKHFKPNSFISVYVVRTILYRLKRRGIKIAFYESLCKRFSNELYDAFLVLSHDRLRDKEMFDYVDFDKYETLKTNEICKSFNLTTLPAFRRFYKIYKQLNECSNLTRTDVSKGFDIALTENARINLKQVLKLYKLIIDDGNPTTYYPTRIYSMLMENSNNQERESFYQYIKEHDFNNKERWKWVYLYELKESQVSDFYYKELVSYFQNCSSGNYYDCSILSKFKLIKPTVYVIALKILVERNRKGSKLYLDAFRLKDYFDEFLITPNLIKEAYLQQEEIQPNFDYNYEFFYKILEIDSGFLLTYIKFIKEKNSYLSQHDYHHISIIWNRADAEKLLLEVFNCLLTTSKYFIGEEINNAFFKNITDDQKIRAVRFLKDYLTERKYNRRAVNTVFDCIRHSFHDYFDEFFLYYLEINEKFENFKEVQWLENSFSGNGDTIWADFKAQKLQEMLDIIERSKLKKYKYASHKEWLKERIMWEKKSADYERKLKFQKRYWN